MTIQSNGKVFKIQNLDGSKVYIAGTYKKYLCQRMDTLRNNFKKWKKGEQNHIRCFDLFTEYGVANCVIVLLESFPCNSKDELNAKTLHWVQMTECMNKTERNKRDKMHDFQKMFDLDKGINDEDEV